MDNGDNKEAASQEEPSEDEKELTPAEKATERVRKQFKGPGYEKRGAPRV